MAEELLEMLKRLPPPTFRPQPYYSSEGDSLYFYFDEAEAYRDRINSILTVYRSFEDRRPTGFQIKDVRAILNQLCDFGFRWKEEGIELRVLFLGAGTLGDGADELTDEDRQVLRELADKVGLKKLEAQDLQSA